MSKLVKIIQVFGIGKGRTSEIYEHIYEANKDKKQFKDWRLESELEDVEPVKEAKKEVKQVVINDEPDTIEETTEDETDETTSIEYDFDSMSRTEIKETAESLEIHFPSNIPTSKLIELIKETL